MTLNLYYPLGGREIRLLRLQPGPDLSFEFVVASIDRPPEYAALSYTWGNAVFPCTVVISGQLKRITQNLHDALSILVSRMRISRSKSGMPGLLWIDALCINQDNLEERSTQVRLMKILYENATKIYVWLGKPQDESNIALATMKMNDFNERLTQTMKKARPYRPWWWPVKDEPPDDVTNLLMGISTNDTTVFDAPGTPTYNAWLGIFALLVMPWWDRTWVYQEATIPEDLSSKFVRGVGMFRHAEKIDFCCGSHVVTWSHFRTTMLILGHLADIPGHQIGTMYSGGFESFHAIQLLRSARSQNRSFRLLEVLQIFRPSNCKDPRDKIYAPLAIASESAIHSIVPDYNRDVLQLYTDVVQYQLQEKGHEFDFLGHVAKADDRPPLPPRSSSSTIAQWPSWLPDWNIRATVIPLVKLIYIQRNLEGRSIKPYDSASTTDHTQHIGQAYGASGNIEPGVILEGTRLHVHAVICDVVHEITDFSFPNRVVDRWRYDAQNTYWTGEPWLKALHHTYAADIRWIHDGLPVSRGGIVDPEFINRPPHTLHAGDAAIQRPMKTASDQARRRRKLCITRNKSLGLIPDVAMPGDRICMFFGSQVLHVLRERTDVTHEPVHTYIGEAYIHGLMDGQVLEALRLGRMQNVQITLV